MSSEFVVMETVWDLELDPKIVVTGTIRGDKNPRHPEITGRHFERVRWWQSLAVARMNTLRQLSTVPSTTHMLREGYL